MRTTKPISTISFNTEAYLVGKLNELVKSKHITLWHFIKHLPEDDEGGNKEHFHVYIEPSKLVQTDDIREQLKEFDPLNPNKPKGCLPFRNSKFDSWYMYSLHDVGYLATKNEERKYHYRHEDFQTSDSDMLLFQVKQIDLTAMSPYQAIIEAQDMGITWDEYLSRGSIPLPQIQLWHYAWQAIMNSRFGKSRTDRGTYKSHAMELTDEEMELIIKMRYQEK